jgi:hypothetical protein
LHTDSAVTMIASARMEYLAERFPDQERFFKYRPGHLGAVLDKLGKRHEWAEIDATDFPFRDGPMSARARARDAFDPNEDSDLEAEGLNYVNLHMQDGGGNLTLGDDSQDERHEHDHEGEDWDPIDYHMEAQEIHRFVRKKGKYVKVKPAKGKPAKPAKPAKPSKNSRSNPLFINDNAPEDDDEDSALSDLLDSPNQGDTSFRQ